MTARQPPTPSWLGPLTSGRNFALVVERLRRAIETGELKAGDKLPSEPELASLLKISRSVVREALKVLELSGYLEVRRGYGGGTFVSTTPPEEFNTVPPPPLPAVSVTTRQLIEVRCALEPYTAGLAAGRGSESDGLEQAIQALGAAGDRPAQVLRATFDFHIEVARIAGNPVFVGVLETLRPASYWAMREAVTNASWRGQITAEHAAIADTIREGADARARDLMLAHVRVECGAAGT